MPNIKKVYIPGQLINNIQYMGESPHVDIYRRGLFKCNCGQIFNARIANIKSNATKRCKKCNHDLKVKTKLKHGDRVRTSKHHYIYNLWYHIKDRCYRPEAKAYYLYGGRGIIMYDKWKKDYIKFKYDILTNIGERPNNTSLDRINNNKGYFPGNLRWATRAEQAFNTRNVTLTKDDVANIRKLSLNGARNIDLSRQFNVSTNNISGIITHRTHKL